MWEMSPSDQIRVMEHIERRLAYAKRKGELEAEEENQIKIQKQQKSRHHLSDQNKI